MGLNQALGLGHLQTRRKPDSGSVLHALLAVRIRSPTCCCSYGELFLAPDSAPSPLGNAQCQLSGVTLLPSAHQPGELQLGGRPSAQLFLLVPPPRRVRAEGSKRIPWRNICNMSPGFLQVPATQGSSVAFPQPPLYVEFCGSIFVYRNITLGWVGLLLIIFMILL